jgi:RNA polymerase sigma-70 factor (ECF subfamily)
MDPGREDVTAFLAELTKGIKTAASKLIPMVYDELRRLAGGYMRRERSDHTLQATASRRALRCPPVGDCSS